MIDNQSMVKKRDVVFDMMKGIAILSMLVGHLIVKNNIVAHEIIYSFHMPLFFILSGYFTKPIVYDKENLKTFEKATKKNAIRLLLPYLVTMCFLLAYKLLVAYCKDDVGIIIAPLLSVLWASGDEIESGWGLITAGSMWFLIALFVAKEVFLLLQFFIQRHGIENNHLTIILFSCLGISLIVSLVLKHIPYIPFCIRQGLFAMAFVGIGYWVKNTSVCSSIRICLFFLALISWPLSIIECRIELYGASMEPYFLALVGSCGGTFVIYVLCCLIYRFIGITNWLLVKPLSWCGRNSLAILCMHQLEMYSDALNSLSIRIPLCYHMFGGGEILIAITLAAIVANLPILRNVYR